MKPSRSSDERKLVAEQVRTYFSSLPPDARRTLRKMRDTIRAAAPGAVEGFSYRMPGFRLDGRPLVWYAAFRQHVSLFPMTASIRRALSAQLRRYKTSTGTVQFPLGKPLPSALVTRLVKARVADMKRKDKA